MIETDDEQKRAEYSLWGEVGKIWTVLGILVAAASLSSLIQRIGDVPLAEITGDVLAYYRGVADQVKFWLFDWWLQLLVPDWKVPTWVFDILTFWIISGSTSVRGHHTALRFKSELSNERDSPRELPRITLAETLAEILKGPVSLWIFVGHCIREFQWEWRLFLMGRAKKRLRHDVKYKIRPRMLQRPFVLVFEAFAPVVIAITFFIWNGLSL